MEEERERRQVLQQQMEEERRKRDEERRASEREEFERVPLGEGDIDSRRSHFLPDEQGHRLQRQHLIVSAVLFLAEYEQ